MLEYSHTVGHVGSPTGIVHADMTLTQSKVKVTGFWSSENCRKLHFLGWLLLIDLITLEGKCPSVSRYVRPSVCTSVHKKFVRFQWNLVCTWGRWVMHDSMPYDPIQGQGQGHGVCEVSKMCTFPTLSPPPFTMAAGKWPLILKLQHNIEIWSDRIFHICRSFCVTHVTLNLVSASTKKFFQFQWNLVCR